MIQADERNPTLTRNPISPSLRSQMHHIRLGMYFVINRRTGKTRRHAMSITRLSSLTGPITISHPKSKFPVPASTQTVGVRIIDSTTSIENLQLKFLMKPPSMGWSTYHHFHPGLSSLSILPARMCSTISSLRETGARFCCCGTYRKAWLGCQGRERGC